MKSIEVKGNLREAVGKKNSADLRKNEVVPCVLYGQGENIHFEIIEKAFKHIVYTPSVYIINFEIGDKKYDAILKDIQYHPVTDKILHADFFHVVAGTPISVSIPVVFEGTAPGILAGGKKYIKLRKLVVKALPKNLPDNITLDISILNIGDTIKVRDIEMENVEFLDPATNVVIMVKTARGAVDDEEEGEEGEEGEEAGAEGGDTEAAKEE